MTEPSQYFKGRTVQEQMNEVIGYVDVRSAEVATNAIAADVAQVHQDMLDADADAAAAAASAAAAAGTLANAVKKTGEASQSIDGDIDLNDDLNVDGTATFGGAVTVQTPTANANPATKKYVDDADALKVSIANINQYAVGLTGNQTPIAGVKEFSGRMDFKTGFNSANTASEGATIQKYVDRTDSTITEGTLALSRNVTGGSETSRQMMHTIYDGNNYARLSLELLPNGTARIVLYKNINGVTSAQTVVTL